MVDSTNWTGWEGTEGFKITEALNTRTKACLASAGYKDDLLAVMSHVLVDHIA